MRGKRGLRPVIEDAFRCDGHQLARAVINQAHHLRAHLVVEAPRVKNLRDLLAKLAVAFQRRLDVVADGRSQSSL